MTDKEKVLDNLSELRTDLELEQNPQYWKYRKERFSPYLENLYIMTTDAYIKTSNIKL